MIHDLSNEGGPIPGTPRAGGAASPQGAARAERDKAHRPAAGLVALALIAFITAGSLAAANG